MGSIEVPACSDLSIPLTMIPTPPGNILSYGSSLYTGAIPTPFTNPLHAAEADAASPAETAARCDELRTLISERLTAALQRERQHMPPARRGQQLVMKTGGAALPDLLPLQEELYELCAEPSDHPLLQGADLGSRPLGSLAHPSKVASSYDGSRTPIIDPRLALLGFLEQATPDAELSARLSRDPEQYVGQIYTTFEHTFHPGSTGSQQGEQVEHLHNVPGATGPVPARLVYLQHPRTEGSDETILNLVWRFEVPMSDNAYEVYVDATRPRTISAVLDWVSSMPADNMFARERAERMREREAEQKRRAALIAKARKTSKYIPSLIAPTFGASKNAQAEEPGTPLVPQYRVFKWGINDPSEGHRSLELGAHDTLASPLGWHTVPHLLTPFPDAVDPARRVVGNETRYLDTRGNNVMAQIHNDTNIDWIHAHRAKGVENASHLVFDFELGWRKADKTHATHPLPAEYADAAISQLFYTVNQIHDLNYRYGFDERAGNFQVSLRLPA